MFKILIQYNKFSLYHIYKTLLVFLKALNSVVVDGKNQNMVILVLEYSQII